MFFLCDPFGLEMQVAEEELLLYEYPSDRAAAGDSESGGGSEESLASPAIVRIRA